MILEFITADANGNWVSSRPLPTDKAFEYELRTVSGDEYSEPFVVQVTPSVPTLIPLMSAYEDMPSLMAFAYGSVGEQRREEGLEVNLASASSDLMAEILIDNSFALFTEISEADVVEMLVLAIGDADMQFQSQGVANLGSQNQQTFSLSSEEQSYLVAVM